jgi:hypothetical protein
MLCVIGLLKMLPKKKKEKRLRKSAFTVHPPSSHMPDQIEEETGDHV